MYPPFQRLANTVLANTVLILALCPPPSRIHFIRPGTFVSKHVSPCFFSSYTASVSQTHAPYFTLPFILRVTLNTPSTLSFPPILLSAFHSISSRPHIHALQALYFNFGGHHSVCMSSSVCSMCLLLSRKFTFKWERMFIQLEIRGPIPPREI